MKIRVSFFRYNWFETVEYFEFSNITCIFLLTIQNISDLSKYRMILWVSRTSYVPYWMQFRPCSIYCLSNTWAVFPRTINPFFLFSIVYNTSPLFVVYTQKDDAVSSPTQRFVVFLMFSNIFNASCFVDCACVYCHIWLFTFWCNTLYMWETNRTGEIRWNEEQIEQLR